MSVYAINKLLYRVEREEAYRKRIQANLDEVLSEVPLSEEERKALTKGIYTSCSTWECTPFC